MEKEDDKKLTFIEAAYHLGVTPELIFYFTKNSFAKASGLPALQTIECEGKTRFTLKALDYFDELLSRHWCSPELPRPSIPKGISDHLRAESHNQCARCGSGIGVDTAHIVPWKISRSHHPNNLIRICSSCHREHDAHQSLSSSELQNIKQTLISNTRAQLEQRMQPQRFQLHHPRPAKHFFGRDEELKELKNALQLGNSVLLTGIGGIGKTEILLQALSSVELCRPIFWLNIEEYRTLKELYFSMRTAVTGTGIACKNDELIPRLEACQACLIFDGVEQYNQGQLEDLEDLITNLLNDTCSTQIIITSQIQLYRVPADFKLRLKGLNKFSSRNLLHFEYNKNDCAQRDSLEEEILRICDGHVLALKFAGTLIEYYGGTAQALQ